MSLPHNDPEEKARLKDSDVRSWATPEYRALIDVATAQATPRRKR